MPRTNTFGQLKNSISTGALAAGLLLVSGSFAAQAQDNISQSDWDMFYGNNAPAQSTAPAPAATPAARTTTTPGTVSDADMEAFLNGTMSAMPTTNGNTSGSAYLPSSDQIDQAPVTSLPLTAGVMGCTLSLEQEDESGLNSNLENQRCRLVGAEAEHKSPKDPIIPSVLPVVGQSVAAVTVGDVASLQNFGTSDAPDSLVQVSAGTPAENPNTDGRPVVGINLADNLVTDENGNEAGMTLTVLEVLDDDEPGDGTFGPLSDQGVANLASSGTPAGMAETEEPDNLVILNLGPEAFQNDGFNAVIVDLVQDGAPAQQVGIPTDPSALAGEDDGTGAGTTGTPLDVVIDPVADALGLSDDGTTPPAGGNRTIVGSLDSTADNAGAGDTDRDGDNDQTDLSNNLQLAVTVLLAELTNADVENHVLARTLADLQDGGAGLQADLQRLLVGEAPLNNDLATDLQNILAGLTTPDGSGTGGTTGTPLDVVIDPVAGVLLGTDTPPPGQGERTIVGSLNDTTDFAGAGDIDGDGDNDQTDLTTNLQLALTILVLELTNANTETHVLATTLADLQGGGDDLQADLQNLLVGGPNDNDLATDLQNIVEGLTTPDGAGNGAGPTGTPLDVVVGPVVGALTGGGTGNPGPSNKTIVGSADNTTDALGAGDTNADGSNDQTDLSNNLTFALTLLAADLSNPDPSTHVLATTLADLQGGGTNIQADLQTLLLGDGAQNSNLQDNLVNILNSLTTPGTGGTGPTGTPLDLIIGQVAP
ncbi:MAG: hypothetical protein ABF335_08920 [Alphaproteobacteria bacterium]